jgi:hypothetical protein
LDKQFDDYLVGEGLDPDTMTQEEKDAEKDAYTQALYPGAVASPDSMVCLFVYRYLGKGKTHNNMLQGISWQSEKK